VGGRRRVAVPARVIVSDQASPALFAFVLEEVESGDESTEKGLTAVRQHPERQVIVPGKCRLREKRFMCLFCRVQKEESWEVSESLKKTFIALAHVVADNKSGEL